MYYTTRGLTLPPFPLSLLPVRLSMATLSVKIAKVGEYMCIGGVDPYSSSLNPVFENALLLCSVTLLEIFTKQSNQ